MTHKRTDKATKGGLSKEQILLLIDWSRHGAMIDAVLRDLSRILVRQVLNPILRKIHEEIEHMSLT